MSYFDLFPLLNYFSENWLLATCRTNFSRIEEQLLKLLCPQGNGNVADDAELTTAPILKKSEIINQSNRGLYIPNSNTYSEILVEELKNLVQVII